MKSFALSLLDSRGNQDFAAVTHFIGSDASGSFGIMAGHAPMLALLRYGLARFCDISGKWHYLAVPGAVLRFFENHLTITTVRYFLGSQREQICQLMADEIARQDSEIHNARATMLEIEHSLMLRMAELSKRSNWGIES